MTIAELDQGRGRETEATLFSYEHSELENKKYPCGIFRGGRNGKTEGFPEVQIPLQSTNKIRFPADFYSLFFFFFVLYSNPVTLESSWKSPTESYLPSYSSQQSFPEYFHQCHRADPNWKK